VRSPRTSSLPVTTIAARGARSPADGVAPETVSAAAAASTYARRSTFTTTLRGRSTER
jgi:hypothetical protein